MRERKMESNKLHSSSAMKLRMAISVFVLFALGSACAVGPDYKRPEAPAVTGYTREPLPAKTQSAQIGGGEEQSFVNNQAISSQWWTLFQSQELNTLIDKSFKASPTLVAAKAALRQAKELLYAQQGFFYPTVNASFSPSRQQASAIFSPPLTTPNLEYSMFTSQVSVSFIPDVFGGNRRQVESMRALAEYQRFELEAAYVTLSSNVVAAAVQEASLRAQIGATKEIIDINVKSLDLLHRQFELGYVARLDVAAQESALALVEQTLPPLVKQLEQTRDLLAALSGKFPSEDLEEKFNLMSLHLPKELPVSLPSNLVEQRPDVRAAEEQLHSASALIGVAVASMIPQISINGALGGSSTQINQMFADSNPFWSIVGEITQPLFAGGTLLHRKRAADAGFEQAAAQYKSTVISAFQNVADTLYALTTDADNLKAAVAAEVAAKVTLDLTVKQQQAGYVNYLSLLAAQQAYQQALITRVQAQANRLSDTAALFQALGGGWWNPPHDMAQKSASASTAQP